MAYYCVDVSSRNNPVRRGPRSDQFMIETMYTHIVSPFFSVTFLTSSHQSPSQTFCWLSASLDPVIPGVSSRPVHALHSTHIFGTPPDWPRWA